MSALWNKYGELIRYGFFGVLTVVVNTAIYWALAPLMGDMWANTAAFFLAVQFAYMTNTKFVFRDRYTRENFLKFWSMRIGTIFLDNGGMWALLALGVHPLFSKCVVNVVVIAVNYICSKFFIFNREKQEG